MHITRIVIGSENQLQTVASTPRTRPANRKARRSDICMLHLTRAQVRRLDRQTQGAFTEMLGRTTTPIERYDQGFRRRKLPDEQMMARLNPARKDPFCLPSMNQIMTASRNAGRNTYLFVR